MNPLIKWPGGKSSEINKIKHIIPEHKRYVEPFFGGGALFFHLHPEKAAINDISNSLIEYYRLIKNQDKKLYDLLLCYNNSFNSMLSICNNNYLDIFDLYHLFKQGAISLDILTNRLKSITLHLVDEIDCGFNEKLLLNKQEFIDYINTMVANKMTRTVANVIKKPFSDEDLKNNLITGFASGYYMYFRKIFNDINLGRINNPSIQYKVANFYFIREYCYGSMFRYNNDGEFNIPYGGMSYNKKNFLSKIENMFNEKVEAIFKNTEIHCKDFEEFINKCELTHEDFMFLDPPYDTDFSDYEGVDFTKKDHERLAHSLKHTRAQFILIIKNTDFINNLYKDSFNILTFDNQYTYNVRSRNERSVEHLIITNIPI